MNSRWVENITFMKLTLTTILLILAFSAFAEEKLTFINIDVTTQEKFQKILNNIQSLTSLKTPESVLIRGVTNDPRIAVAEFYDEVKISSHYLLMPVFAHEIAHIFVYYNLRMDVVEFYNRHELNMKLRTVSAHTPAWDELRSYLQVRYEPRLFSLHFEEVFGDLISSYIFNDAGVMDKLEALKGFRDFEAVDPKESHPSFWDEHYSLQSFGKHIYKNYLKPKKVSPQIIFDTFYEIIKEESQLYATSVVDLEKSPWITPPIVSKKDGKLQFNKVDMNAYISNLQNRFDDLIRNH
jgi:hypothetical protein